LNGRLAVLGAGKIGGILLRAFLQQKLVQPKRVHATVRHAEKARALAEQLGIEASTDNRAAVRGADIVLLAVKPQAVREVLEEIKPEMKPGKLIVSVVASVPTQLMEKYLGLDAPVVRAMPNTPCAIGCGMTGLAKGIHAGKEHLEIAQAMFEAVGRVVVVDEKQIDAVTGLSASGTAFIYIILESLAEGGVKVGLPRDISTLLAAQTMIVVLACWPPEVIGPVGLLPRIGFKFGTLTGLIGTPTGVTTIGAMAASLRAAPLATVTAIPALLAGCRFVTVRALPENLIEGGTDAWIVCCPAAVPG